ncbi:putative signal transduction protein with CBS domain containing protein [Burkholderia sp. MR1]|nr:putative signal transduction protein with CBS domain containing protein [Burkholderia sp. MR1]
MTRDVRTIDAATPLSDVLAQHFGPQQAHRAYPVVRDGALVGMLDRAALVAASGAATAGDAFARQTDAPPVVALPGEPCRLAATRLAVHELERLPVVSDMASMKLVGIVSRSDLVKPARAHFDDEHQRERFRTFRRAQVLKKP